MSEVRQYPCLILGISNMNNSANTMVIIISAIPKIVITFSIPNNPRLFLAGCAIRKYSLSSDNYYILSTNNIPIINANI